MSTPVEVLCKSFPPEFVTYFQVCRSLRFEDKPDYSYMRKLFRDLFIREGYQYDYVFDWTILKYQQTQAAGGAPPPPPPPPVAGGVAPPPRADGGAPGGGGYAEGGGAPRYAGLAPPPLVPRSPVGYNDELGGRLRDVVTQPPPDAGTGLFRSISGGGRRPVRVGCGAHARVLNHMPVASDPACRAVFVRCAQGEYM
jgi:hypothetical protein